MKLVLAACVLVVGGCSGLHPPPGPLRIDDPVGGVSMRPPEGPVEWWGTVGSIMLCPRSPIRLIEVTPTWDAPPREHLVTIHRFVWKKRIDSTTTPIISARGRPPSYDEPYATLPPMTGTYTRDLDGLVVGDKCRRGGKVGSVANEILVSMLVGPEGAEFHKLTIIYEAGGHRYSQRLKNWSYTLCGTATRQPRVCPKGQQAPGVDAAPE